MGTRDLIMFAMSTFSREYVYSEGKKTDIPVRIDSLPENTYFPPNDSEPIQYVGQMEPIVKWIMQSNNGNSFDLVMLCSKETYTEYYSEQDKETAVQFFARKISNFFDTSVEGEIIVDEQRPFCMFDSKNQKIRFILVPLDTVQPMKAIQSTVEYIRGWKQSTSLKAAGNFYIDIHGGFRDLDLIQNAIISLLKIDGIVPSGVYTGHYSKWKREFQHQDASYAYGMFDFVSAMNEFINFGHGKALKEYLDKTGSGSKEEIEVTVAMDEVSRGLELCDPQTYQNGLENLNVALNTLPESTTSELNIFREYIRDSFGDLLNGNKRTVLLIVKRCMEKELFQQALTFIESSMPAEIVEKKLLYYPETNANHATLDAIGIKNNTSGSDRKYIFVDYQIKRIYYFPKGEPNDLNKAVAEFADHFKEFMSLLSKKTPLQNIKMQTSLGIKGNIVIGVDSVLTGHDRKLLGYFLRMHKALKKCRNTINHGNSNRPDFEKVQKLLKLYVAYGEALYSRAEKK